MVQIRVGKNKSNLMQMIHKFFNQCRFNFWLTHKKLVRQYSNGSAGTCKLQLHLVCLKIEVTKENRSYYCTRS